MRKSGFPINKYGCTCGLYAPSMCHQLTCPKKSIFLLSYPAGHYGYGSMEDHFKSCGYQPSVTVPKLEDVRANGDWMAEMMQCDCGHWFPRWKYYRCTKCFAGH